MIHPVLCLHISQLLNNFSYALGICVPDSTRSGSRKRPGRTILQSLLLSGLCSSHNSSCVVSSSSPELLISDVDWDVVDDTLWHYEVVPSREPTLPAGDEENTSGILSFTALADSVVSTVVHLFEIVSFWQRSFFVCNVVINPINSNDVNRFHSRRKKTSRSIQKLQPAQRLVEERIFGNNFALSRKKSSRVLK